MATEHPTESPPGQETDPAAALKTTIEDVREEGRQFAAEAKATALRAAEEQKSRAAEFVRDVSGALHKGCDELRERGRVQSAEYIGLAADELDRLSGRMAGQEVGSLLGEIESFARRRPGLMFGAALLAGFGVIRFAMSASSARRYGVEPGAESHAAAGMRGAASGDSGGFSGPGQTTSER